MSLKDKVAGVTGAARGLGQEVCLALSNEGARVVAADVLPCSDTVEKVRARDGDTVAIQFDVSESQSTQAIITATLERFRRMDILVNNAAVLPKFTPFDQISEAEWDP